MEEMKDRIKAVRLRKGLTQIEFSNLLGISLSNLQSYESGRRNPSTGIIVLIASKCGANEKWIRDGIGEPFAEKTKEEEIAEFTASLLSDTDDVFKRNFIHMLSKLEPEDWTTIEKMVDLMVQENNKKAGE